MRFLDERCSPLDYLNGDPNKLRKGPSSSKQSSRKTESSSSSSKPDDGHHDKGPISELTQRVRRLEEAVMKIAEAMGSRNQRISLISKYGLQRSSGGNNLDVPPFVSFDNGRFSLNPHYK